MKFLAILRDSYKEAVSGWVLQSLMVLAGLLMILVVGLSFRPLSPEEDLARRLGFINLFTRNDPNAGRVEMVVENFVQLNAPEPLWKGDYKFEVVARTPSKEDLKKAKEAGLPVTEDQIRDVVKGVLSYLKNVTVTAAPAKSDGELRYEVRTQGTKVDDPLAWRTEPHVFFAVPTPPFLWMSLRQAVYRIEKTMVNDFGAWAAMLVSVVVTAGFIPNMLRKGALDLYIAKPIGRIPLLLYKFVGGLTFVFLLAAFTVGGVWLVIGIRTGVWAPHFLATIPVLTFYFATLYAISTLIGVLTRSPLVAILVTIVVWTLVFLVGFGHDTVQDLNERARKEFTKQKKLVGQEGVNPDELKDAQLVPAWIEDGLYATRKALPRTYDLDSLSGRLIAKGVLTEDEMKEKGFDKPPFAEWPEVLIVSFAYIAGMLGLASWRLATRDG